MLDNHTVTVIIPALNEEESLPRVLRDLPRDIVDRVIVVDNGSCDNTILAARDNQAEVLVEPKRGYGAACLKGIQSIEDTDIVVILDADYSDYPEQITRLVAPIACGQADFVLGSRTQGVRESGALTPQAYWGNKLTTFLIRLLWGFSYTDMGPFRAIRFDSLKRCAMQDTNYGWNVEMQIKALKHNLRIREVAVDYRKRIGRSKISGTLRGVISAGIKIIISVVRYTF